MLSLMDKNETINFWIVNLESMRDSLNLQGDKLKFTRKKFKKDFEILLIIVCLAFDGYKTYKY